MRRLLDPGRINRHNLFARKSKESLVDEAAQNAEDISESRTRTVQTVIKEETWGLKIWHQPPKEVTAAVDVVFIHGLTGNSQKTWTHKDSGIHWPSSLLSKDIGDSRILAFGYDADVVNFWNPASQNRLSNHAENLLGALANIREQTESEDRPIIFVVHSLGGLVVQRAIGLSRSNADAHLRLIESSTIAVAFLGTPHCGSDLAPLAESVAKITAKLKFTNVEILSTLKPSAEVLADAKRDFHSVLRLRQEDSRPIAVTCFYEELPLSVVGEVVPRNSATIAGYASYGIHSHHKDMTKFSSQNDPGYLAVLGELRRWRKLIRHCDVTIAPDPLSSRSPEELGCLQRFYTSDYQFKRLEHSVRVKGTCEWILKNLKYQQFQKERTSCLLRLTANPGQGKSVLASFLIDELHSQEIKTAPTVCFFFFQNDDDDRNTADSCLRGLLHQLLIAKPAYLPHALKQYREKSDAMYREVHTLWSILTAIISDPQCGNIIFIIDALDECEELSRTQLTILLAGHYTKQEKDVSGGSWVKCLITTRPHRATETLFSTLPNISMQETEENDAITKDVATFVKIEVAKISAERQLSKTVQNSLEEVLKKSSNLTFLWASLALQELRKSPKFSAQALQQVIHAIPPKLEDVYETMLSQSPSQKELRKMLHIFLAAFIPLSVDELNAAFAVKVSDKSCRDLDLEPSMTSTVRDICGTFVKVVDSKVHFIHQTARQFLVNTTAMEGNTSSTLWKGSIGNAESHGVMARCCMQYLLLREFEPHPDVSTEGYTREKLQRYTKSYPFFEYAARHWGYHFERASSTEQESLISSALSLYSAKSTRFGLWSAAIWTSIAGPGARDHVLVGLSPLMVASYFRHISIMRSIISTGVDVSAADTKGWSALHWAAWDRQGVIQELGAVQLLINAGIDVSAPDHTGLTALHWAAGDRQANIVRLLLNAGADHKARDTRGNMPQHHASARNRTDVIAVLLEAGVLLDIPDGSGLTTVDWAVMYNNTPLVDLLVKNGASLGVHGKLGFTLLQSAIHAPDDDMAIMLINHGADLEARHKSGCTALHFASQLKKESHARLLVERGANLEATDARGYTPLHGAVASGSMELLQFLLSKGANSRARTSGGDTVLHCAINHKQKIISQHLIQMDSELEATNNLGRTVLHLAAWLGDKDLMELLLKRGANAAAKDNEGNTALHVVACSNSEGATGIVQLLLQNGAEVNSQTGQGSTPLSLASIRGHEAVAELLIQAGADLELMDMSRMTAIQHAAVHGKWEVFHLILVHGAVIQGVDKKGYTTLHHAAFGGDRKILQSILEKDVDIDSTNPQSLTALHIAASKGNKELAKLLLEKGALVDRKDAMNTTALGFAAMKGHREVFSLLLERNANVNEAFAVAVMGGDKEIVQTLLTKGADVNMREAMRSEMTPLHLAAAQGHESIVYLLIEHGANVVARNTAGHTASHVANSNGHRPLAGYLRALEVIIQLGKMWSTIRRPFYYISFGLVISFSARLFFRGRFL